MYYKCIYNQTQRKKKTSYFCSQWKGPACTVNIPICEWMSIELYANNCYISISICICIYIYLYLYVCIQKTSTWIRIKCHFDCRDCYLKQFLTSNTFLQNVTLLLVNILELKNLVCNSQTINPPLSQQKHTWLLRSCPKLQGPADTSSTFFQSCNHPQTLLFSSIYLSLSLP